MPLSQTERAALADVLDPLGLPLADLTTRAGYTGEEPPLDTDLALALADRAGGRIDAIAFRAAGTPLGTFLAARAGTGILVTGRLEHDSYLGRSRAKLHVDDAAAED